ncbi:MAG: 50S ribosomal protein L6, partial [Gemmatimonadaceae bacterium]
MSRIGRLPIPVPKGVTVTLNGSSVQVKGPKGELSRTLHRDIGITLDGDVLTVTRPSDEERHKALHGLSRTLVFNMVEGVTKGYQKQLEITGVGYKAEVRPYGLQLALGFSHQIEYKAPKGIKLTAPQPTQILIDGADKE